MTIVQSTCIAKESKAFKWPAENSSESRSRDLIQVEKWSWEKGYHYQVTEKGTHQWRSEARNKDDAFMIVFFPWPHGHVYLVCKAVESQGCHLSGWYPIWLHVPESIGCQMSPEWAVLYTLPPSLSGLHLDSPRTVLGHCLDFLE